MLTQLVATRQLPETADVSWVAHIYRELQATQVCDTVLVQAQWVTPVKSLAMVVPECKVAYATVTAMQSRFTDVAHS